MKQGWQVAARVGLWWMLAGAMCGAADAEDGLPEEFAFEGVLERLEAELAPALREGLVLFGVYSFSDDASGDEDPDPERARFDRLAVDLEVTLDRHHVAVWEAESLAAGTRLELAKGVERGDECFDLYALSVPLDPTRGSFGDWQPRWLQLWFYGAEGSLPGMLQRQGPPATFTRGWWRVTFSHAAEERTASAEGRLFAAGPAGTELERSEQVRALEGVVRDLSLQIEDAEQRERGLAESLRSAEARIDGLQRTIDRLVEEREALRGALRAAEAVPPADAEALRQRVAELEAADALQEEARMASAEREAALSSALAQARLELRALREQTAGREPVEAKPGPTTEERAAADAEATAEASPPSSRGVLVVPTATVQEHVRPLKLEAPAAARTEASGEPTKTTSDEAATPLPSTSTPKTEPTVSDAVPPDEEAAWQRRPGKFRRR